MSGKKVSVHRWGSQPESKIQQAENNFMNGVRNPSSILRSAKAKNILKNNALKKFRGTPLKNKKLNRNAKIINNRNEETFRKEARKERKSKKLSPKTILKDTNEIIYEKYNDNINKIIDHVCEMRREEESLVYEARNNFETEINSFKNETLILIDDYNSKITDINKENEKIKKNIESGIKIIKGLKTVMDVLAKMTTKERNGIRKYKKSKNKTKAENSRKKMNEMNAEYIKARSDLKQAESNLVYSQNIILELKEKNKILNNLLSKELNNIDDADIALAGKTVISKIENESIQKIDLKVFSDVRKLKNKNMPKKQRLHELLERFKKDINEIYDDAGIKNKTIKKTNINNFLNKIFREYKKNNTDCEIYLTSTNKRFINKFSGLEHYLGQSMVRVPLNINRVNN